MNNPHFTIIDHFIQKNANEVIDQYQIIISSEAIYILNTGKNYSQYVKSLFSGLGEIIGLFGDFGFIGELASEITGNKLSTVLKKYAQQSSQNKLQKILQNLDQLAAKEKDIHKIYFGDMDKIVTKKGYFINGDSFIEFYQKNTSFKLYAKHRNPIIEFIKTLHIYDQRIKITSQYF